MRIYHFTAKLLLVSELVEAALTGIHLNLLHAGGRTIFLGWYTKGLIHAIVVISISVAHVFEQRILLLRNQQGPRIQIRIATYRCSKSSNSM